MISLPSPKYYNSMYESLACEKYHINLQPQLEENLK